MAFTASISVNVDAVTAETVANATGEVLFQLGAKLFAAVSRLRRHVARAQAALRDAPTGAALRSLGAEVASAQERMEDLVPLLVQAAVKYDAECAAHANLRRRPLAIDFMTADEWDIISEAGSVFAVDYPSTAGTDTESESRVDGYDTDKTNESFDLINWSDRESEVGTPRPDSDTTDDDRPAVGAARRRPPTPHPTSSPSALPQPQEFGPSSVPPLPQSTTAPRSQRARCPVQVRWEQPFATPWDAPPQTPSASSVPPPASFAARPSQQPSSSADSSASSGNAQHSQRVSAFAFGRDTAAAAPSTTAPSSSTSAAPRGPHTLASSPTSAPRTGAELAAETVYDALSYDGQIYGYVGGSAVPVVPAVIESLSTEMLGDLDMVAYRRRRAAESALKQAKLRLQNTPSSDDAAVMALVTKISALEMDLAKAEGLQRVVDYEDSHRRPASGMFQEEREVQRRLIEDETRRLQTGGTPVYWSKSDEVEAKRIARRTPGSAGYQIWHPAAWSPAAAVPSLRRPQSSPRIRARSRVRFDSSSSSSAATRPPPSAPHRPSAQYNPVSQSVGAAWTPRDDTEHARQQLREKIYRMELQREGNWVIPPSRVVHVSPLNEDQDEESLRDLIRRYGFDIDEDSRVVEYYVTHANKGDGVVHHFGFVTFLHLAAAVRCVRQLDPMNAAGHGGMTPLRRRADGVEEHVKLTFSFSTNKKPSHIRRQLDARRRSSSRGLSARRQPRRSPVPDYDDESDETGLEDY